MPDSKFDLGDYVQVKDRIAKFYELFGQGRLVTRAVYPSSEPDGVPRIWVKAAAYRTPDDPLPGIGWSWMVLPGTSSFTRGSELENVETSAWGRAIGSLGILIDGSIATQNEVDSKAGERPVAGAPRIASDRRDPLPGRGGPLEPPEPREVEAAPSVSEPFEATVEGKVTFSNKAPVDGNYRQTPDGLMYGFVIEAEGGKRLQVVATHLSDALQKVGAPVKGTWVTVEGLIERIAWKKDGRDMPGYQRMTLSRIVTPEYTLPAPKALAPDAVAELDALEVPWPAGLDAPA